MEKTEKREKIIFGVMTGILIMTALFSLVFILKRGDVKGRTAIIISEGKEVGRYDLGSISGTTEVRIQPEGSSHYNLIEISQNGICVKDSDCGGKDCINAGIATHSGDTIACLPNRLIITITSDDPTGTYDAMTY